MENKELNQMIRAAIGWAGYVNGKQGLIDISYAMGLDETHCSGCEEFNPHFDNCCVVCGQHNEKNKPNKMKAHLVYVSMATRVVVDENATEQNIIKLANAQIINNIIADGIFENVEQVLEDNECPYDADFDNKLNK